MKHIPMGVAEKKLASLIKNDMPVVLTRYKKPVAILCSINTFSPSKPKGLLNWIKQRF